MSKKVLILSTSPRRSSNSEALAEAFADGARAAGHEVELISLRGKDLRFCQGCFARCEIYRMIVESKGLDDFYGDKTRGFRENEKPGKP